MEIDRLRARDVLGAWQKGGEEIALNDARATADFAFLAFAFQTCARLASVLSAKTTNSWGHSTKQFPALSRFVTSSLTLRTTSSVWAGSKGENGSVQEMLDTSHAMDDLGLLILVIGGERVDAGPVCKRHATWLLGSPQSSEVHSG